MLMQYCYKNTTLTPFWTDNGISLCLYHTIYPIVLVLFALVLALYHHYQKRKYRKKRIKDDEKILINGHSCINNAQPNKCFKDFPYSQFPVPFLYVVQLVLHILQIILPVLHVLIKAGLCNDCIAYINILNLVAHFISWILGYRGLKHERQFHCIKRIKGHSIFIILFWTLAFILEILVFVSWNSGEWYLELASATPETKLDLAMFCLRLIISFLIFVLGVHAPGLHKDYYDLPPPESNKELSFFAYYWDKTKKLWPFIWPKNNWLRIRVLICFFILIATRVVNVFVPIQFRSIVNYFTDKSNKENPWGLIATYMVLASLQSGGGFGSSGLLGNLRSFLWIKVQQYTSRSIQVELFEHLHNLSLKWHLQRKTGEVIRMIDRGSTSIESLLSYVIFQIFPTILDIIVAIIYFGSAFNGWFALIVFLTMSMYLVSTIAITEWRTKYRREMNTKENITKAAAVDSLLNFETVKYYNNEKFEVKRYDEKIEDYQDAQWMTQVTLNILNTVQNVIITVGLMSGMFYSGHLVVTGVLTVGDFVLFMSYIRQLYAPLNFFGTYYRLIQSAFIDMENMFELLEEEIEINDVPNATVLQVNHGMVEFKNVNFSYDPRKAIIKDVSFSVLPGQTVALVGPSGSGKSTIIRLLFRFYDIQSGSIRIDGQEINQVKQRSLRQHIGVVPQDTVLFNDTIKYNIAYGRVDSDDQKIQESAASADIHNKILNFVDGYSTLVGERGLKLSGGEKQRVAIARTLLKSPDIVLLDEATSALDTQTERNIQASLNRVCTNKTTIVVAHRLSTIIGADQILVLKDGEIVEHGRHRELVEKNGLYAAMWQEQLKDSNKESKKESNKKDD